MRSFKVYLLSMLIALLEKAQTVLVVQAIAFSVQTLLGPHRTLKVVETPGEISQIISDGYRVLRKIDIRHPVGTLLKDLCQAHYKHAGSGVTTLVALCGALTRRAYELVQKGISIFHVLEGFRCATDQCIAICQAIGLSTSMLPFSALLQGLAHAQSNCDTHLMLPMQLAGKVASRFLERQSFRNAVVHTQTWDFENVFVKKLAGSPASRKSFVVDGIVVAINPMLRRHVTDVLQRQHSTDPRRHRTFRVLAIDGAILDPAEKRPYAERVYSTKHPTVFQEDFSRNVRHTIERLASLAQGSLLLAVRGAISPVVRQCCENIGVLVVSDIAALEFLSISRAAGVLPVYSLFHAKGDEQELGGDVEVYVLEGGWLSESDTYVLSAAEAREYRARHADDMVLVLSPVCTTGKAEVAYPPLSVVVCAATQAECEWQESQFWKCLHRLHNSFRSGLVLPGAGVTEIQCILALERLVQQRGGGDGMKRDIIMIYSEAIHDLMQITLQNCGLSFAESCDAIANALVEARKSGKGTAPLRVVQDEAHFAVFDDYLAKTSALSKAFEFTCCAFRLNYVIVAGEAKK